MNPLFLGIDSYHFFIPRGRYQSYSDDNSDNMEDVNESDLLMDRRDSTDRGHIRNRNSDGSPMKITFSSSALDVDMDMEDDEADVVELVRFFKSN